jgi:hypothetical protein
VEKDLIIGGFTNYNYNQLKPWVESIDECGFKGDKVMVVGNSSDETKEQLLKRNFRLVQMPNDTNIPIHVLRFLFIYEYLKIHWQEYRYVVTTDVKDVYFQKNPFEWLEKKFDKDILSYGIVCGSECLKYKDEPWGNDNLMQTYGPYVYDEYKDKVIYNVGVLGGRSEYIKDLVFHIFTNGVNRPIPIVDQAVFNVLIGKQPFKDITYLAQMSDAWACQAGTVADPSKIEQFRPNLTEKEPTFKDGKVYNADGEEFYIVHQYDRVPEWKESVMKKYSLEDLIVIRT